MQVIRLAAALVFATGTATAQETDCDALQRSSTPFQITYAVRSDQPGQSNGVMIDQYWRGEGGSGRLLRRSPGQSRISLAETRNGFVTRWRGARNGRPFEIEFILDGLDRTVDHFTRPHDFTYVMHRRHSAGPETSTHSSARFRGEETVTLSGCSFRVLLWEIEERGSNAPPTAAPQRTTSIWYAPELHAYLRLELRLAPQAVPVQAFIATRIDTRFQAFDTH